ncbi:MAG: hypothetical protein EOP48_14910 [Sphingobacteriales bacterium]|nr:MAG: hypothetical protein EOP48_14910 [Sphingobacteriales bacterium]
METENRCEVTFNAANIVFVKKRLHCYLSTPKQKSTEECKWNSSTLNNASSQIRFPLAVMVLRHLLMKMAKYLLIAFTIILIALTTLFGWTFINRWTMPFNSEGNYFDQNAGVVYHQQSVLVYGLITLFLLSFTVLIGLLTRKRFK